MTKTRYGTASLARSLTLNLVDAAFQVGDHIVSTCGSMYRGYEGVVTEIQQWDCPGEFTDVDGWHYSVALTVDGRRIDGGFTTSQMVRKEQDAGRAQDIQCENCPGCRLPRRRKGV